MAAAEKEMEGFEVFEPCVNRDAENWIGCVISRTYIKLTRGALEILNWPDYVVVFFDKKGKRMMMIRGQKTTKNAIRLTKSYQKAQRCNYLRCVNLNAEIETITGRKPDNILIEVLGHKVNVINPTVIFDLGNVIVKEKYGTKK